MVMVYRICALVEDAKLAPLGQASAGLDRVLEASGASYQLSTLAHDDSAPEAVQGLRSRATCRNATADPENCELMRVPDRTIIDLRQKLGLGTLQLTTFQ
jgi:hypothetical protein